MKKSIFYILGLGIFIGFVFTYISYEAVIRTSNAEFCISCHEMAPMKASYDQDVHGGNGRSGIRVDCVDCHLPHDNIFNYLYTKTKKSAKEVSVHFLTNVDEIDWHKKRKHKENYVYDDGCIKCHTNYDTNKEYSSKAFEMHKHYKKLLNTNKSLICASCHVEVGHKGLNNMLNIYNPIHEIYKKDLTRLKDKINKKLYGK